MRILIVTHYFPPEIGAPQARLSELARAWSDAGDEVTVLTGMPNHPTGVVPPAYRRRLRIVEQVDGYRVVRTWLYATPNEGFVKKTLGHLSFMVTSVLLGARRDGTSRTWWWCPPRLSSRSSEHGPSPSSSAHPWSSMSATCGQRYSWSSACSPTAGSSRLLERLELWAYGQATEVVVVSEGFRQNLIRRGVPAEKVTTVRNGADVDLFSPGGTRPLGDAGSGLPTESCSPSTLARMASPTGSTRSSTPRLSWPTPRGHPFRFVLVGEGANRSALVGQVESVEAHNVTMRPGVPRDLVPDLLAAADICLVPLRDIPLFSTFIPSKIFEYFAAGQGGGRGAPRRGRCHPP